MERIVVNPNAAYDKFKDKRVGTKGLGGYSDCWMSIPDLLYGLSMLVFPFLGLIAVTCLFTDFSDRISKSRRVGYESGDYELVSSPSGSLLDIYHLKCLD